MSNEGTIFIHAGMGKTGTSALQSFLFANRKKFIEESLLYYPETGLAGPQHRNLALSFRKENFNYPHLISFNMDDFIDEIGRISMGVPIVISSEFLRPDSRGQLGKLIRRLNGIGRKVKLVLYVRRQDEYINSVYLQWVKIHGDLAIIDEMREFLDKFVFKECPRIDLDFYQIITKYADILGDNAIIIRPYAKQQLKNANIIEDFFDVIGVDVDIPSLNGGGIKNPSLNYYQYRYKLLLNHLTDLDIQEKNRLGRCLVTCGATTNKGKSPVLLSPALVERIKLRCAASNESLMRTYSGLSEYFRDSLNPAVTDLAELDQSLEPEFKNISTIMLQKHKATALRLKKAVDYELIKPCSFQSRRAGLALKTTFNVVNYEDR